MVCVSKKCAFQSGYKTRKEFEPFYGYRARHKSEDGYMKSRLIIPELSEPPVRTLGATIPENESHIFR